MKFETYLQPQPYNNSIPVGIQVLSTLMFGAFAIVATIFAFNAFWPAGVVVAIVLGIRGGFAPGLPMNQIRAETMVRSVAPESPAPTSSGNASFDAYRGNMLARLEQEQDKFEGFLTRLRDAKDKSEFDSFMEERAEAHLGKDRTASRGITPAKASTA